MKNGGTLVASRLHPASLPLGTQVGPEPKVGMLHFGDFTVWKHIPQAFVGIPYFNQGLLWTNPSPFLSFFSFSSPLATEKYAFYKQPFNNPLTPLTAMWPFFHQWRANGSRRVVRQQRGCGSSDFHCFHWPSFGLEDLGPLLPLQITYSYGQSFILELVVIVTSANRLQIRKEYTSKPPPIVEQTPPSGLHNSPLVGVSNNSVCLFCRWLLMAARIPALLYPTCSTMWMWPHRATWQLERQFSSVGLTLTRLW